ncbi:MAG: hypothetical protein NTV94_01410 [Planctomycetota bacterium]|nr:hypothetical protein [Planctomycetota bacterium]
MQSRLKVAEGFLGQQVKELDQLEAGKKTLDAQLKQIGAVAGDHEGEAKRLEAKMEHLREQMNNAQTNKEYQAFLVELNTIKIEKDRSETAALDQMGKGEELRKQLAEIEDKKAQREQVRSVAAKERNERYAEIEGRLNELKAELVECVTDVPKDTMIMFQRLLDVRGDEAMGAIEIVDRKRHEYHCGTCMMAIPMEAVNGLLSGGRLTRCSSCQCVIYLTREDEERMRTTKK